MSKFILTLAVMLMCFSLLQAQEFSEMISRDTFDLEADIFEDPDPMDFTLTLDLKKYQKEKYEGEYIPVHLFYQLSDSFHVERSIRIKARGQFRREHCTFAPFWLNIRKSDIKNELLQDTKKMKIVTHCNGGKAYSEYVLKEYLAYKIYNLLSPVSFRVRLIRMKYIDTGRKNKETENWAFMIEPEEMLAERFEGIAVKKDELSMHYMRPDELDLTAMFMYMIGNADYSIAGRHNVKVLGLPEFGTLGYTPVPYDFDYSGIVNAHYAIPGENLGIQSVRERYFLGLCREDETYQKAIDYIATFRNEILELVNDFPYLEAKHKKEMTGYLESYFNSAAGPNFITRELKNTCR